MAVKMMALGQGLEVLGCGSTLFYEWIGDGRLIEPIKVGRGSRWFAHELEETAGALAAGAGTRELRALVEVQRARRKRMFDLTTLAPLVDQALLRRPGKPMAVPAEARE